MTIIVDENFQYQLIHGSTILKPTRWNLEDAVSHPQVTEDYLREEARLGRVVEPLPLSMQSDYQISRFGMIPKNHQSNKWLSLCYPRGHN